jgi:hypothetical protein
MRRLGGSVFRDFGGGRRDTLPALGSKSRPGVAAGFGASL